MACLTSVSTIRLESLQPQLIPLQVTMLLPTWGLKFPIELWYLQLEHLPIPLPGPPRRLGPLHCCSPDKWSNTDRPILDVKGQRSDPLIHVVAELGSYKQAHISLHSLTTDISTVEECPASSKSSSHLLNLPAGGDPMERWTHITDLGCTGSGPIGKDLANRCLIASPNPRPEGNSDDCEKKVCVDSASHEKWCPSVGMSTTTEKYDIHR